MDVKAWTLAETKPKHREVVKIDDKLPRSRLTTQRTQSRMVSQNDGDFAVRSERYYSSTDHSAESMAQSDWDSIAGRRGLGEGESRSECRVIPNRCALVSKSPREGHHPFLVGPAIDALKEYPVSSEAVGQESGNVALGDRAGIRCFDDGQSRWRETYGSRRRTHSQHSYEHGVVTHKLDLKRLRLVGSAGKIQG